MAESEEELKSFLMKVKNQQLEPDMKQRTGSRLGNEYARLYIVTLLI